MDEKLRFGIVGCGVIGPVHAEAIASLPDAQLVSVVDINSKQAEKLAGQYGARPYTQLQHMLHSESVAVAVLRFASGALGTIAATTGAYPGVTTRIEIFGDKGSAVIENGSLSYLHLARDDKESISAYGVAPQERKKHEEKGSTSQNPAALSASSHALQIADMMRAIREDGTPLVDGYAGLHPVEIILSIYESARLQKEVTLS
jgi:UDP-N-acetyl-2-amino-2-deoxyglucuronate dehydrogenase